MQVILIGPNKVLNDLITINLKNKLNVDVIARESADDTIELLKILPTIDLIITSLKLDNDKTAQKIISYLRTSSVEIPIIVLGNKEKELENDAIFIEGENWQECLNMSAKLLNIDEKYLKEAATPNYIPIPSSHFLHIDTSCCDVYIRIRKSAKEFQFIKRIHRGDVFSKEVIFKYVAGGLENFYIPKEDKDNFTTFISNELVKKLTDAKLPLEQKIEVMNDSFNFLSKEIQDIGFTPATIQLTEELVKGIIEINKESQTISPLLTKVLNSKSGYIYQHSHLTAIVSCEIAKELGKDNDEIYNRLSYASLFKDISLVENEEYVMITSFEQLENAGLDEQKWDMVFNHALEAAILVRSCPEAPIDIDNIIKVHHGAKNGKGFSINVNPDDFDPLAMVFIIAIEFANELLDFKLNNKTPRPIVEILKKKYTDKVSLKIINALESIIKKKTTNE